MGFDNYAEPLKTYLTKYRDAVKGPEKESAYKKQKLANIAAAAAANTNNNINSNFNINSNYSSSTTQPGPNLSNTNINLDSSNN